MMTKPTLLNALTGDDEIAALLGDAAQLAATIRFEIALAEPRPRGHDQRCRG